MSDFIYFVYLRNDEKKQFSISVKEEFNSCSRLTVYLWSTFKYRANDQNYWMEFIFIIKLNNTSNKQEVERKEQKEISLIFNVYRFSVKCALITNWNLIFLLSEGDKNSVCKISKIEWKKKTKIKRKIVLWRKYKRKKE